MKTKTKKFKNKLEELTKLFTLERNIFDKLVVIYKYFRYLSSEPLAKKLLRKIHKEAEELGAFVRPDEIGDVEEYLEIDKEAMRSKHFWMYLDNLGIIHDKLKELKKCKLEDREQYEKVCELYSKPYSEDILALSLEVVNSKIFEEISKENFAREDEIEKISFDEKRSILTVKGQKIKISKQDKITNAHKILKYILITNKDNLKDDFFYSEIAEDEFGDIEYSKDEKAWERYHDTCKYINKLAEDQTDGHIEKLLLYNTGKQGRVKLNKIYI